MQISKTIIHPIKILLKRFSIQPQSPSSSIQLGKESTRKPIRYPKIATVTKTSLNSAHKHSKNRLGNTNNAGIKPRDF